MKLSEKELGTIASALLTHIYSLKRELEEKGLDEIDKKILETKIEIAIKLAVRIEDE